MRSQELILKLKSRDNKAYGELYKLVEPKVFFYCNEYIIDNKDVEDLVQDTITRFLVTIDKFKCECTLENWIYRIASSVCKNHILHRKYKKRDATVLLFSEIQNLFDEMIDKDAETPLDKLIKQERQILIENAKLQLTTEQKIAFTLKINEQLTYNEIASKMGKTTNAVKQLIQRSRIKMITYLI